VGFVGRERELSRLRAVVGGADARLLLVIGDALVGKTRLVDEGMRRAAADGVVAVWGGCLPMQETPPLLPVADALGELSRVDGGDLLDALRPELHSAGVAAYESSVSEPRISPAWAAIAAA
jgi:predicted ATPase